MCLYFVSAVSDRDPEEGAEMPPHVLTLRLMPILCVLKKVQKCPLMCLYFVPAVSDRVPEEDAEMPTHVPILGV